MTTTALTTVAAPTPPTVEKDPREVVNYGFDLYPAAVLVSNPWAPPDAQDVFPWLLDGEEAVELVVTSDGGTPANQGDITIVQTEVTQNSQGIRGALLVVWLDGGTPGVTYKLTFTWKTNASPVGRKGVRTMYIQCMTF